MSNSLKGDPAAWLADLTKKLETPDMVMRKAADEVDLAQEMGPRIVAAGESQGRKMGKKHAFGTLPVRNVDAMLLRVPGDARAVVITSGLMNFANLLMKAVASVFQEDEHEGQLAFRFDEEAVRPRMAADSPVHDRFISVMACAATDGAHPVDYFMPEGNRWRMGGAMRHAAEAFEIGSLCAQEMLEIKPRSEPVQLARDVTVQCLRCDKADGRVADAFGVNLAIAESVECELPLPIILAGIDGWLTARICLDAMKRKSDVMDRREAFRYLAARDLPEALVSNALTVSGIVERLWDRNGERVARIVQQFTR